MNTKAIRLSKQHQLSVETVTIPPPKSDEILLAVSFCGICKTDAKMWAIGQRDLRLPRILGHEFCGMDTEQNHYVVWPGKSCGICQFCKRGDENLCDKMRILGFHNDGGMSEFCTVPTESLISIPKNSFWGKELCFAEPLGCAINGIEQIVNISSTDNSPTLLILGGGVCGLLTALAAKTYGLEPIIYEKSNSQINKIKPFCSTQSITFINSIEELSGCPVDSVLNAHPHTEGVIDGLKALKKQGVFCYFSGITDKELPAKAINLIHYKQLTIVGAYGCRKKDMERAISMISDTPDHFTQLIEKEIGLNDVPEALQDVHTNTPFRYIINLLK